MRTLFATLTALVVLATPAWSDTIDFGSGSNVFPASYSEHGFVLETNDVDFEMDIFNNDANGEREAYFHNSGSHNPT